MEGMTQQQEMSATINNSYSVLSNQVALED